MSSHNSINLLSRVSRKRRQVRSCFKLWTSVCAAAGICVLGTWITFSFIARGQASVDALQLADAAKRAQDANDAVASLRADLAKATARYQLTESVVGRPDWSVLLATLAKSLQSNVSLREVRVDPGSHDGKAVDQSLLQTSRARITLSARAKAQQDVSAYTLRLQNLGVFDKVQMLRSGRVNGDGSDIEFQLECSIGEEGASR